MKRFYLTMLWLLRQSNSDARASLDSDCAMRFQEIEGGLPPDTSYWVYNPTVVRTDGGNYHGLARVSLSLGDGGGCNAAEASRSGTSAEDVVAAADAVLYCRKWYSGGHRDLVIQWWAPADDICDARVAKILGEGEDPRLYRAAAGAAHPFYLTVQRWELLAFDDDFGAFEVTRAIYQAPVTARGGPANGELFDTRLVMEDRRTCGDYAAHDCPLIVKFAGSLILCHSSSTAGEPPAAAHPPRATFRPGALRLVRARDDRVRTDIRFRPRARSTMAIEDLSTTTIFMMIFGLVRARARAGTARGDAARDARAAAAARDAQKRRRRRARARSGRADAIRGGRRRSCSPSAAARSRPTSTTRTGRRTSSALSRRRSSEAALARRPRALWARQKNKFTYYTDKFGRCVSRRRRGAPGGWPWSASGRGTPTWTSSRRRAPRRRRRGPWP